MLAVSLTYFYSYILLLISKFLMKFFRNGGSQVTSIVTGKMEIIIGIILFLFIIPLWMSFSHYNEK